MARPRASSRALGRGSRPRLQASLSSSFVSKILTSKVFFKTPFNSEKRVQSRFENYDKKPQQSRKNNSTRFINTRSLKTNRSHEQSGSDTIVGKPGQSITCVAEEEKSKIPYFPKKKVLVAVRRLMRKTKRKTEIARIKCDLLSGEIVYPCKIQDL